MTDSFDTGKHIDWLREFYFSDPVKQFTIAKGDTLLKEDRYNDKLFLIIDGTLAGFLKDESEDEYEVLKSVSNMFVGVYSFFSAEHKSYLTLIAEEKTTVAYIDQKAKENPDFEKHFLPVIVNEIYSRQTIAQKLTQQRHAAIKMLHEKEKMVTLGQLAAGLAHELNNAIGVLEKNTEWLSKTFPEYLKSKKQQDVFNQALQKGLPLNTQSLREKRKLLEKRFNLPVTLAKQLAKTELTPAEIEILLQENHNALESISMINDAGIVLHDMNIAAKHATHVVQSVRALGITNTQQSVHTTIAETLEKALALTKTLHSSITISLEKESEGDVVVNPGDLVQVWMNLIKNSCESMSNAKTENPVIKIRIANAPGNFYAVSIIDNGPGIPSEIMPKIFQPNFTTKVNGLSFGLGLGLSIVKKIIHHYKGTIEVESVPGDTRFIVQLPKP